MAFCRKCGEEIHDEAVICPKCGGETGTKRNTTADNGEDNVNVGIIVATLLIPLIGLICGIVNLIKGKNKSGAAYLVTGLVAWAVYFAIMS